MGDRSWVQVQCWGGLVELQGMGRACLGTAAQKQPRLQATCELRQGVSAQCSPIWVDCQTVRMSCSAAVSRVLHVPDKWHGFCCVLQVVLVGVLMLRPQIVSKPAALLHDAIKAIIDQSRAQAEVAKANRGVWRPA